MGTRADYWIKGKNKAMTWMGSTAFDGYPDGPHGIEHKLQFAKDLKTFKKELKAFFAGRMSECKVCNGTGKDPTETYSTCLECPSDDVTLPNEGWPWPWESSRTTDYSYIFDKETSQVVISGYGGQTFTPEDSLRYDKYKARIRKHNDAHPDSMKDELESDDWLAKYSKCKVEIVFPDMTIVPGNIFRSSKSGVMVLG